MSRACGHCDACCRTVPVEAVGSTGHARCPHLGARGAGCTIHAERPPICRAFECLWLGGLGSGGDRPDRIGVMFVSRPAFDGYPYPWVQAIRVEPAEDTAPLSARAEFLISRLAEVRPVEIVHRFGTLPDGRPWRRSSFRGRAQDVTRLRAALDVVGSVP